jgi:large subunit ribosomal protein L22
MKMEARAIAKYVKMSPVKLQPVADLVRGKKLSEALTILKFTPGKGAQLVEKVVKSAAANAENNFDMNPDELYVAEIYRQPGTHHEKMAGRSTG